MPGPDPDAGPDGGSATVWAAGLAALLVGGALLALSVGTAVLARHRAGAAADFGALAAASYPDAESGGGGPDGACARAQRAVRADGAALESCRCADGACTVRAAVDTLWDRAFVTSRAGRVGEGPDPGVPGAEVDPDAVGPAGPEPGEVDAGQAE